jgi:hypothetical protein
MSADVISLQFVDTMESVVDCSEIPEMPQQLNIKEYSRSIYKIRSGSAASQFVPTSTIKETNGATNNGGSTLAPMDRTLVRAESITKDMEQARREPAGSEQRVSQFLDLLRRIKAVEQEWRRAVFCGREPIDEKVDQIVRGLYVAWLAYSHGVSNKANLVQNDPGVADVSSGDIDKQARIVGGIIRDWKPPVLSRAYSFRAPPLSPTAAARLKELFPESF